MIESHTIYVDNVIPGKVGGALFKGPPISSKKVGGAPFKDPSISSKNEIKCKADWNVIEWLPRCGEFWQIEGQYIVDPKHGKQFHITKCFIVSLPEKTYVSTLLAYHPKFKGFYLGPTKVEKLIDKFKSDTLVEHLDNENIYQLNTVISKKIAEQLVKRWDSFKEEIKLIYFIGKYRFPFELIQTILHLCKYDVVDRLCANPYALVPFSGLSKGFWPEIEKCARDLDISFENDGRLIGAIEHVLYRRLRYGHTATKLEQIYQDAFKLTKSKGRVTIGINLALKRRRICVYRRKGELMIQLVGPAFIELELENRIAKLSCDQSVISPLDENQEKLRSLIKKYSNHSPIKLTIEQQNAVAMALTNRCSIITGHGGTGKTTTIKAISKIAKQYRSNVFSIHEYGVKILALAGKAKEHLRKVTEQQTYTIHSFIKIAQHHGLDSDIFDDPLIIVDEASMVDVALFNRLLAIFDGCKYSLLTVGDPAQISPVGFGLVWHQMVKSKIFPRIHLSIDHRQDSELNGLSMKIRSNQKDKMISLPVWKGQAKGVFLMPAHKKNIRDQLVELNLLEMQKKIPSLQILTPHMSKKYPDSGNKINRYIQKNLNGHADGFRIGQSWMRIGDPVIVTKNSYSLGLFNGMTGVMTEIHKPEGRIIGVFKFEGKKNTKSLSIMEMYSVRIRLAYAISFHKSQGSEYEATAVSCLVDSDMVERSLLYTAVSRAKKLCIIVGSEKLFNLAANKPPRAETLDIGFMSNLPMDESNIFTEICDISCVA